MEDLSADERLALQHLALACAISSKLRDCVSLRFARYAGVRVHSVVSEHTYLKIGSRLKMFTLLHFLSELYFRTNSRDEVADMMAFVAHYSKDVRVGVSRF